jgi:hypothetical protein
LDEYRRQAANKLANREEALRVQVSALLLMRRVGLKRPDECVSWIHLDGSVWLALWLARCVPPTRSIAGGGCRWRR